MVSWLDGIGGRPISDEFGLVFSDFDISNIKEQLDNIFRKNYDSQMWKSSLLQYYLSKYSDRITLIRFGDENLTYHIFDLLENERQNNDITISVCIDDVSKQSIYSSIKLLERREELTSDDRHEIIDYMRRRVFSPSKSHIDISDYYIFPLDDSVTLKIGDKDEIKLSDMISQYWKEYFRGL
jgi:hypothetical protein